MDHDRLLSNTTSKLVAPLKVGWREGSSPSRSRQTGREPLDSSGFWLAAALCWLISIAGLASSSQPVRLGPLLGSHYKTFIANTPQSAPVRGI